MPCSSTPHFSTARESITRDFERSAKVLQISSAFGNLMATANAPPLISRSCDDPMQEHPQEGMGNEVQAVMTAMLKATLSGWTPLIDLLPWEPWHPKTSRISFSEVLRKLELWI